MSKMAIVDVMIPAFNAAKYLPIAIESVISQTFDDWRILIVDDGSTDNTSEIIVSFVDRLGSKIRYIKQENRGVSAARNTVLRASTAEYIALLDADDVWLPCRLSESLKVLAERPQAGISYGLIQSIDPEGRLGSSWAGNLAHAEGHIAPYIYMRAVELPSPTITVRRKCIDEVGIFDESLRVTEDRDLWLRIALRHEVAFVPKILAHYRMSPSSLSTDPNRMLQAQIKFIRKHYGADGCGLRSRQAALARCYKQQADNFKMRGQMSAALRSAVRAVTLDPLSPGHFRTAGSLLFSWMRSSPRNE
jgi:glycosyltransferase involved in cell wall biosynthesis